MKRIGRRALLVGAITLGLATPALAEVRVSQSADRKTVGSDDTFEVTVTVSGLEGQAELSLPRSPDLQILGQSQSTQTSFTTGPSGVATEREQQIHLQMRATRSGSVTIPGAVVTTGGATLRAQPLQLEVRAGHVAGPRAAPDPNDPFAAFGLHGFGGGLGGIDPFGDDEDPFAQLRGAERLSPSDVKLVATLDRRSVVVGQQATLELWLLTRAGVSVGGLEMPKVDGALSEEIATPGQPKGQERVVGGVSYRAFLLAKRALFPQHAGRLDIGAAQADVTASGLLQSQRLTPRSAPLTLEVRAVPPGGPVDEAIGVWTLGAELSPAHAAVGEPLTLRLSAQGTGDLKALTLPALPALDGVDAFAPTVTDTPAVQQGLLGGRRVAEIVLMPRRPGELDDPGAVAAVLRSAKRPARRQPDATNRGARRRRARGRQRRVGSAGERRVVRSDSPAARDGEPGAAGAASLARARLLAAGRAARALRRRPCGREPLGDPRALGNQHAPTPARGAPASGARRSAARSSRGAVRRGRAQPALVVRRAAAP